MIERTLTLPGTLTMDALLVSPDVGPARGAAVVVQGLLEPCDEMRDVSRRIASEGYVAIAPWLRDAAILRPALTNDDIASCIARVLDFAHGQPHAATTNAAVIGFGLGGFVALLAACRTAIRAAVSFYPRGLVRPIRGLRITPALRELKPDVAPVLGLFGAQDERVPPGDVASLRARLVLCRVAHELVVYPHVRAGFVLPERGEYREQAATHAWSRTLDWLGRLQGHEQVRARA